MSTFGPTPSRAGFRQMLTPLGTSRKRKDRDAPLDAPPPPPAAAALAAAGVAAAAASSHPPTPKPKSKPAKPKQNPAKSSGAMSIAGYLAHEFLTRGTLFGECLDPTAAARWEKKQKGEAAAGKGKACGEMVGGLVMGEGGACVPGVVNPTQLALWLHTKP